MGKVLYDNNTNKVIYNVDDKEVYFEKVEVLYDITSVVNGATLRGVSNNDKGYILLGVGNYTSPRDTKVILSKDFGKTWTTIINNSSYGVYDVSISSTGKYQYILYDDGSNKSIYKSTDYGTTWSHQYKGELMDAMHTSKSGQYVILNQIEVHHGDNIIYYYSDDYGTTWTYTTIENPDTSGVTSNIYCQIIDNGDIQIYQINEYDSYKYIKHLNNTYSHKPISFRWKYGISVRSISWSDNDFTDNYYLSVRSQMNENSLDYQNINKIAMINTDVGELTYIGPAAYGFLVSVCPERNFITYVYNDYYAGNKTYLLNKWNITQ